MGPGPGVVVKNCLVPLIAIAVFLVAPVTAAAEDFDGPTTRPYVMGEAGPHDAIFGGRVGLTAGIPLGERLSMEAGANLQGGLFATGYGAELGARIHLGTPLGLNFKLGGELRRVYSPWDERLECYGGCHEGRKTGNDWYTDALLTASIGSRWQFDGWFIGWDWLTVGHGVRSVGWTDNLKEAWSVRLTNFTLGATF
jgi:hypothetical protein